MARLVRFRGVGLGVRAPLPGRNDGLGAPLRPPRAEGVAVIGPVGHLAGLRRARPGFQGPGLGAVVALAAAIRQDMDLGAEAAPSTTEGVIRPLVLGCARRARMHAHDGAVQRHGGQIRIGLQIGHQAQPDTPVAPVDLAAIDRVPLAVLGGQLAPRDAHACHPARRFYKKATNGFPYPRVYRDQ